MTHAFAVLANDATIGEISSQRLVVLRKQAFSEPKLILLSLCDIASGLLGSLVRYVCAMTLAFAGCAIAVSFASTEGGGAYSAAASWPLTQWLPFAASVGVLGCVLGYIGSSGIRLSRCEARLAQLVAEEVRFPHPDRLVLKNREWS